MTTKISKGTKLIDDMRSQVDFTPKMREWLEQTYKLIRLMIEYKKYQ
jgi:hypothetical protein